MKTRVTIVGYVHHRPAAEEPSTFPARYSRQLEGTDEPYRRFLRAGPEWTELQIGWPEWQGQCSLLCIECQARKLSAVPSEEERLAAEAAALEVGVGDTPVTFATVRPGEASFRLEPVPGARYSVRCPGGEAKFSVLAVSK